MHELEINLKFVCNDVNLRKEGFIMKRFVISVFLVLMMFAFIGCDTTTENNDDSGYDLKYLGYEASNSECRDSATKKGYNFYSYTEDGSCYGRY